MRQAKQFVFVDKLVNENEKSILFRYRVIFEEGDEEFFEEKLILPKDLPTDHFQEKEFRQLLSNLHLILGISYYKMWVPPEIVVENNFLDSDAAEFWNTVYTKGLGEFFYKNKIDFRGLIKFPYVNNENDVILAKAGIQTNGSPTKSGMTEGVLVGIGGGKDSLLAAHLLVGAGFEVLTAYKKNPLMESVAKLFSKNPLEINRILDPKLLTLLDTDEVYNGHIPISAIYAFVLVLYGYLYDYKYVVVGNERSSNYGSLTYLGEEINHQWSKSRQFENLFREYVEHHTPGVRVQYFSLLRPFYEIEIVRRFCEHPQYFPLFSSCNKNFKIINPQVDKKWCGNCPKCAFVFALMAGFVSKEKLISIFGDNLFAKESLIDTYRELLGIKDIKPFDCVGTPAEVKVAFHKAYTRGEYKNDIIMKMFKTEVLSSIGDIEAMKKEVFSYGDDGNIPDQFRDVI